MNTVLRLIVLTIGVYLVITDTFYNLGVVDNFAAVFGAVLVVISFVDIVFGKER